MVLKEGDVEKSLYRQKGGQVFENLTSSNGDEKNEREEAKLGGDRHFEGNWGLHFWDAHGSRNRLSSIQDPGYPI